MVFDATDHEGVVAVHRVNSAFLKRQYIFPITHFYRINKKVISVPTDAIKDDSLTNNEMW